MDRTMYEKANYGPTYRPYRITLRRGRDAEAPGCEF